MSTLWKIIAAAIMAKFKDMLKVLSANRQGLQNLSKRMDVSSYFKDKHPNILCFQGTHWIERDRYSIRKLWGMRYFLAILN